MISTPTMRLPLDFPPLVEMAERAAIEHSASFAAACAHGGTGWSAVDEHNRHVRARAFASLLSDLTRPESQALWLRWLAERLGVPVPVVGAPCWYLVPKRPSRESRTVNGDYLDHDDGAPAMWVLAGDGDERTFAWWDSNDGPPPAPGDGVDVWLPSWPDAPLRALGLAIVTVAGRAA